MPRPALIFDFGNVFAFFDYAHACDRLRGRTGKSGAEWLAELRAAGLAEVVRRYEVGQSTSDEFTREFAALSGLELPADEFAAAWADIFTLNRPVVRLVRALKERGYTLVLGSNTNALHAAHFRRAFAGELAAFDRLVLSFEVRHLKPDAGFYLACADAAGAPPAECVFIDDLPENVEGARAAGLSGLLYRDAPTLLADLGRLGVDVEGIDLEV